MTNGFYLLALFTLTAALPASAATPTILPMGDSITLGIDYTSGSSGGYRDPLYKALSSAGMAFTFVGANNANATPALSAAGQTYHDGFGGWHIADMNANLDGVANPIGGGNGNLGGYLLTGSHGTGRAAVSPDYILLHLGTNDFLQETANPEADLQTLVTHIHALCPNTVILVASVVPINSASFTGTVNTFNAYIQYTLVPSLLYLRFVDEHAAFLNADGTTNASLIGNDLVHPTGAGYAAMAAVWANALKGVIGGTTPTPTPAPTPIPAPAPTPTTFTLTVEGGTGSGTYPSGTSVTVAADAAAGAYSFFSWQGSTTGLTSSTSATTSLLMPSANATLVATYALPVTTSTPTPTPPAPGTSLGVFALLNQSAPTGNSLNVEYGVSSEGGRVITYWSTTTPGFKLLSEGSGKYEITENIGGRCLTFNGTSIATNTCSSAANQLFSLLPQTDGSYAIQNGNACVAAAGSFQVVNAMPCVASATQHWVFSGPTPLVLPSATGTIVNSPTVPSGYHLTFDDEFASLSISDANGTGANWYTHTVQCCLSDTSDPGTPTAMAGIGDPQGQNPFSLLPGGGLDIRLQKMTDGWYSGVLATVDQAGKGFAQQYGYFEMAAQLPKGLGTWPAFWLLNQAHLIDPIIPAGEIDIDESYGQFPTMFNTTLHNWTPPASSTFKQAQVADLTSGYHTFGMLWTASTMTFYCDGATLYSFPTPSIMNQPYYPIIDLGLGGGWPTNATPAMNDMIVKYVRVYAA